MDISFNNNLHIMNAHLTNRKDGLFGNIYSSYTHGNITEYTAYISKLDIGSEIKYFKANIIKRIYHDGTGDFYVKSLVPFNSGSLYMINTPALQHGMNMIKGFFTSNKYRDYVMSHSKRAKLISKKRKLNREISKIDKELD